MEYARILNRLAPCGLHCGMCFAFTDGDISFYSKKLEASLGNFEIYARRFVDLLDEPVFNHYPEFKALLSHLVSVECSGYRKERCKLFKDCKVRDCSEEKGIDFCFQCEEFPCNKTGFDEHLHKRSMDINLRMKKIGEVQYYNEVKDKPGY